MTYYDKEILPIITEAMTVDSKPTIKIFAADNDALDSKHFDVTIEQLERILSILNEGE